MGVKPTKAKGADPSRKALSQAEAKSAAAASAAPAVDEAAEIAAAAEEEAALAQTALVQAVSSARERISGQLESLPALRALATQLTEGRRWWTALQALLPPDSATFGGHVQLGSKTDLKRGMSLVKRLGGHNITSSTWPAIERDICALNLTRHITELAAAATGDRLRSADVSSAARTALLLGARYPSFLPHVAMMLLVNLRTACKTYAGVLAAEQAMGDAPKGARVPSLLVSSEFMAAMRSLRDELLGAIKAANAGEDDAGGGMSGLDDLDAILGGGGGAAGSRRSAAAAPSTVTLSPDANKPSRGSADPKLCASRLKALLQLQLTLQVAGSATGGHAGALTLLRGVMGPVATLAKAASQRARAQRRQQPHSDAALDTAAPASGDPDLTPEERAADEYARASAQGAFSAPCVSVPPLRLDEDAPVPGAEQPCSAVYATPLGDIDADTAQGAVQDAPLLLALLSFVPAQGDAQATEGTAGAPGGAAGPVPCSGGSSLAQLLTGVLPTPRRQAVAQLPPTLAPQWPEAHPQLYPGEAARAAREVAAAARLSGVAGDALKGLLQQVNGATALGDAKTQAQWPLLPPSVQQSALQLLVTFHDALAAAALTAHMRLQRQLLRNTRMKFNRGELTQEASRSTAELKSSAGTALRLAEAAGALLDRPLPEFPMPEEAAALGAGGLAMLWNLGSVNTDLGPFDDEPTRSFYRDLPDLAQQVPARLLGAAVEGERGEGKGGGDGAAAPVQSTKPSSSGLGPGRKARGTLDDALMQFGGSKGGSRPPPPPVTPGPGAGAAEEPAEDVPPATDPEHKEEEDASRTARGPLLVEDDGVGGFDLAEEDDDGGAGGGDDGEQDLEALLGLAGGEDGGTKAGFDACIESLWAARSRERIDAWVLEFVVGGHFTKLGRGMLIKAVFVNAARQMDCAPYVARMCAIFELVLPGFTAPLVALFENDLRRCLHRRKWHALGPMTANVRLTAELLKFGVCPPNVVFRHLQRCVKGAASLVPVQLLALILERCGRYLVLLEGTRERAVLVLESVKALQRKQVGDGAAATLLSDAYNSCMAPEETTIAPPPPLPPLEGYVRYLLLEYLNEDTINNVIMLLRKLPWSGPIPVVEGHPGPHSDEPMTHLVERVLFEAACTQHGRLEDVASVVSGLCDGYHPQVAQRLVDRAMRVVLGGLSTPPDKDYANTTVRLSACRLLAQLYVYCTISDRVLLSVLHNILRVGHELPPAAALSAMQQYATAREVRARVAAQGVQVPPFTQAVEQARELAQAMWDAGHAQRGAGRGMHMSRAAAQRNDWSDSVVASKLPDAVQAAMQSAYREAHGEYQVAMHAAQEQLAKQGGLSGLLEHPLVPPDSLSLTPTAWGAHPAVPCVADPEDNHTRIYMVCGILGEVAEFFGPGSAYRKAMARFVTVFQRYCLSKRDVSISTEFMLEETLEKLRPRVHRFRNYAEAAAAAAEVEWFEAQRCARLAAAATGRGGAAAEEDEEEEDDDVEAEEAAEEEDALSAVEEDEVEEGGGGQEDERGGGDGGGEDDGGEGEDGAGRAGWSAEEEEDEEQRRLEVLACRQADRDMEAALADIESAAHEQVQRARGAAAAPAAGGGRLALPSHMLAAAQSRGGGGGGGRSAPATPAWAAGLVGGSGVQMTFLRRKRTGGGGAGAGGGAASGKIEALSFAVGGDTPLARNVASAQAAKAEEAASLASLTLDMSHRQAAEELAEGDKAHRDAPRRRQTSR